jgi:hypothetical protein
MKRFNVSKLKVSLEPLLPGRDPKAGIDQELDTMFERALSVREFARSRGWPLPEPERFKWRRCLLVILGAILGHAAAGAAPGKLAGSGSAAAGSAAR